MQYADLNTAKKAFIFELDDVLFPVKDYDLQIYYLFANFLEYQEAFPPAADLVQFMKKVYDNHGPQQVFEKAQQVYAFDGKYKENFERLHRQSQLPLKLLLYKNMLNLLQEIIVDRKQIFIVTAGNPEQQLNKIKHIEWHGLEPFLKVYFADEIKPKPDMAVLKFLMEQNSLQPADLMVIGLGELDCEFAKNASVDFVPISDFDNNK